MPNIITLTPESKAIQYLCKKDKRLAKVISLVGSISYIQTVMRFWFTK